MKTRGTKKAAAPDFLSSPAEASPDVSLTDSPPIKFSFNLDGFNNATGKSTASAKKTKRNDVVNKISAASSVPAGASLPMNSIADLKALASSQLDAVKRQFERSHSDFLKDVEAFHSRLHKRLKVSLSHSLSLSLSLSHTHTRTHARTKDVCVIEACMCTCEL